MPGKARLAFGFPDIHWATRDKTALSIATNAHRLLRPDLTILGGDVWDCTPFSRFGRKSLEEMQNYQRTFCEVEMIPSLRWVNAIAAHTKRIVWLEGNHDAWLGRWVANAPCADRIGSELLRSPLRYMVDHEKKLEVVPWSNTNDRLSKFALHPRLITCHGWCANKYAARKHLELSRSKSVIFHHTHRAQREATRDPHTGDIIEAMSAGCLCKRQPIWQQGVPTDWVHGFWIAYLGRHTYTLFAVRIERGRAVLPDGREVGP